MDSISPNSVFVMIFTLTFLLVYGTALSFGLYQKEKKDGVLTPILRPALFIVGVPLLIAVLCWVVSNVSFFQDRLGSMYQINTMVGIACSVYSIPAVIAILFLYAFRKNTKRWLFVSIGFALLFLLLALRMFFVWIALQRG